MASTKQEALRLGLLESLISCSFVINKCQIQAGNVRVIPKSFVLGYLVTNTSGHILSFQNKPINLGLASLLSVCVESITRNQFTSTRPNILSSSFIFGRELCFWSGIGTTNYFLKEENNQTKAILSHFIFSGILGNVFDSMAGICLIKKHNTKQDFFQNINKFKIIYRQSITPRIISSVIIPSVVINTWFLLPSF